MAYTEKYVRADAAGGGDGSTDTNSGGSGAWTWAEMLTNLSAGQRANIKAGSYSRTTSNDTFSGSFSFTNPAAIRGFNATAGDLDSVDFLGGGGDPVTTNWPAVTYTTGSLTLAAGMAVEGNIKVDGAPTGKLVIYGNIIICHRLWVNNTHASSSTAVGLSTEAQWGVVSECYVKTDSSDSSAVALRADASQIVGCRVECPSGRGILAVNTPQINNCAILNCDVGISLTGTFQPTAFNCSFYNCATACISGTGFGLGAVNCVAYSCGKFFDGGSNPMIISHCATGGMGGANTGTDDWPVLYGVSLSTSPFTSSSNLTLNSTAGGGADCQRAGLLGKNIGAFGDTGGGGPSGGLLTHPGMAGGMRA